MEKIGILTFHASTNYGAFLQTYALSTILKRRGYDVKIINLELENRSLSTKTMVFYYWSYLKFKYARERFLNLTQKYRSSQDIKNNLPDCDLYIVGSDQVWNPKITKSLYSAFFFDFLPSNKKRISYAASFGEAKWPYDEDKTQEIFCYLKNFNAISVRESSAVNLCREYLKLDATQVLDPTLLLKDYSEILGNKPILRQNKVVIFKFNKGKKLLQFIKDFKKIVNQDDIIVLRAFLGIFSRYFKNIPAPSVKQWIRQIATSSLVITDSFHGVCFAILFHKQFIVIPAHADRFTRIESLLEQLGLQDRIFHSYQEILSDTRWKSLINYTDVDNKLSAKRDESLIFIDKLTTNSL